MLRSRLQHRSLRTTCSPATVFTAPPVSLSSCRFFSTTSNADDGYPLKPGSRLDRAHKFLRAKLSQGAVFHSGKVLGLVSAATNDIVTLRLALIIASIASMLFHTLFKDPRPARIFYGFLSLLLNLTALGWYLCSKSDFLWPIENEFFANVHAKFFKPKDVSNWEFLQMMGGMVSEQQVNTGDKAVFGKINDMRGPDGRELAHVEIYRPGEWLVHQGAEMKSIWLVLSGTTEITRRPSDELDKQNYIRACGEKEGLQLFNQMCTQEDEPVMNKAVEGNVLGEFFDGAWDCSIPHYWRAGCRCTGTTNCTVLRIPKQQLHNFVLANPHAQAAVNRIQLGDLWNIRRLVNVQLIQARARELELQRQLDEALKQNNNQKV